MTRSSSFVRGFADGMGMYMGYQDWNERRQDRKQQQFDQRRIGQLQSLIHKYGNASEEEKAGIASTYWQGMNQAYGNQLNDVNFELPEGGRVEFSGNLVPANNGRGVMVGVNTVDKDGKVLNHSYLSRDRSSRKDDPYLIANDSALVDQLIMTPEGSKVLDYMEQEILLRGGQVPNMHRDQYVDVYADRRGNFVDDPSKGHFVGQRNQGDNRFHASGSGSGSRSGGLSGGSGDGELPLMWEYAYKEADKAANAAVEREYENIRNIVDPVEQDQKLRHFQANESAFRAQKREENMNAFLDNPGYGTPYYLRQHGGLAGGGNTEATMSHVLGVQTPGGNNPPQNNPGNQPPHEPSDETVSRVTAALGDPATDDGLREKLEILIAGGDLPQQQENIPSFEEAREQQQSRNGLASAWQGIKSFTSNPAEYYAKQGDWQRVQRMAPPDVYEQLRQKYSNPSLANR